MWWFVWTEHRFREGKTFGDVVKDTGIMVERQDYDDLKREWKREMREQIRKRGERMKKKKERAVEDGYEFLDGAMLMLQSEGKEKRNVEPVLWEGSK